MNSLDEWWLFIGKPRQPVTAGTVAVVTVISVITLFAIVATLTA